MDVPLAPIVELLLASTALLLLIHGSQALLKRRSSAATRERLWRVTWIALVLLPLSEFLLPPIRLGLGTMEGERTVQENLSPSTPLPTVLPWSETASPPRENVAHLETKDARQTSAERADTPFLTQRSWLVLLWLLGGLIAYVPAWTATARLRRARRSWAPVADEGWNEALARTRTSFRMVDPVDLVVSDDVSSPSSWRGSFARNHVLLLPAHALSAGASARDSILRHELAHAQRNDVRALRFARFVTSLYWFHPLAWLALHTQRAECERACDDLVLSSGQKPSLYAEHLLETLERATASRRPTEAVISMTQDENVLMHRIRAILDPTTKRRPPRRVASGMAAGTLLVTTALLGALSNAGATVAPPRKPDSAALQSLERGLAYLAASQDKETGGWIGDVGYKLNLGYQVTDAKQPHLGVSALCLRAFVLAGHTPWNDTPHRAVVERGMAFLMRHADLSTGYVHARGTRMKSHALALACLADLLRLRPEKEPEKDIREKLLGSPSPTSLRDVVATATAFSVTTQNEEGGWRYHPYSQDSDALVTTLMIEALVAAQRAGMAVSAEALDKATQLVLSQRIAEDRASGIPLRMGSFRYQITPNSRTSLTNDAAGVAVLAHDPRRERDLQISLRNALAEYETLPEERATHYFRWFAHYLLWEAHRNTPRASIATALWKEFEEQYTKDLLALQGEDGSWPNDVGPGPAFASAVACLWLGRP
ncbi:MAG: M56 family metallopeptidase [Planctomycetes bacterium]|nr:M56 family metallopeptidase [Planctomycetota bacterium]